MPAFQSFPIFYDSAGQILSAGDLNIIRDNVRLIDGWSFRNEGWLPSSSGVDTNTPGFVSSDNPLRIWWGAARFVAGCTTITVEGYGAQSSAEVLRVYVGGSDISGSGTLVGTITPPASAGAFSGAFALSGFSDGDVVPIEIRAEGAHLQAANWQILDVYLSPISLTGWPGVPSVTSSFSASALNQLCAAAQWCYDRMRLVPNPAQLVHYYNLGPFKDPASGDPQHTNRPMFYGSIGNYETGARLWLFGAITSITTTGWGFVVYLNGTAAYTSPTYGIGTQVLDQYLTLPGSLGSRVRVHILASVSNGGATQPLRFTRFTFGGVLQSPSGGWPYGTLPSAFAGPSVSQSGGTVAGNINTLGSVISAVKARIDARPERWARSRAARRAYTRNTFNEDLLQARARPYVRTRAGAELFAKGKGMKLAWGPITVTPDENANGWEQYTFQHETALDDTALVPLDAYPGLDYGATYRVLGDPLYVAEYIG